MTSPAEPTAPISNAVPFSEAVSRKPINLFQWATVAICMLVLVCDGLDMQLLGLVAPKVIAEFGVDSGAFGIAMSAALVGMGIGAWGGGWLGDKIGRRYSLALAAISFGLATIAASYATGVGSMAILRLLGGLGFGAAYANALAMGSEWFPEKWRAVAITTLSVGTPAGTAVAGALVPDLLIEHGWRGTFMIFGVATLFLLLIIMAILRDSPSFLFSKGKEKEAKQVARKVLTADEADALVAEPDHSGVGADGKTIGVLHRSNLRLNIGVGLSFAASTVCAYGVFNWATTFLQVPGLSFEAASYAVSIAGMTSIAGAIGAGILTRMLGSKPVMIASSAILVVILVSLLVLLENISGTPDAGTTTAIAALIGAAAAVFSCGIATIYVIIANGYPASCRSAGIGFGIFVGRIGAILVSFYGGSLIDFGAGSLVPFFIAMIAAAALVSSAGFIVDRHVMPAGRA